MKVKTCSYDLNYGTIAATLEDGSRITLLRTVIERDLEMGMIAESRLDWLIDNELGTYVELYLDGELQEYCTDVERRYYEQAAHIQAQLEKRHSPTKAEMIARETMMYG